MFLVVSHQHLQRRQKRPLLLWSGVGEKSPVQKKHELIQRLKSTVFLKIVLSLFLGDKYGYFNGFTIHAPGSINISDQQNGPFPKA
jgi:hypothetical protein